MRNLGLVRTLAAALFMVCAAGARAGAPALAAAPAPSPSDIAQELAVPPGGDIPAEFKIAEESFDHHRREVEMAMRDGVKLHTVILIPKAPGGAGKMPILLTRTPYDADKATTRAASPRLQAVVSSADDVVALAGYIRVFQDVRGKYGSEGEYVMNRPLRGPLNPTAVDHATDTWDTIDWLVKNVPETNGRVGMIGTSYPGFLVLMGLFDPHPALKVAVPVNPMVDCWIGDDWFHNGAFRQGMALYVYEQTAQKKNDFAFWTGHHDEYTRFLAAGSAGALGREMGMEQLPFWRRLTQHPAYDSYWQEQAVDRLLRRQPLTVPTLHIGGFWDQEDIYGAPASYAALEAKDTANDRNFLVLGPWRHGGSNGDGRSLGAIRFDGDTALTFRRDVLQPFLDRYLKSPKDDPKDDPQDNPKSGAAQPPQPPVLAYQTGADRWQRYDRWPQSCSDGCPNAPRKLYLQPGFGLGFRAPAASPASSTSSSPAADAYVSDPSKPVPYRQRPVRPMWAADSTWGQWLVDDQRFASDRTDVLVYVSHVLTTPLAVAGTPVANLFASTTGTDADWVVKLIDLYPDEVPTQPELGGYQLAVSMDILRGRYRESFEKPSPIPADSIQRYSWTLPAVHHVFAPGHRIMIQIQSTWFPLYDRNPQTWVDNIFFAQPADYRPATHRVFHGGDSASFVELPVVGVE